MPKMKTTRPLVSIGIPVYNGEKYITETINAVLAQTYEYFELIISDNNSTDRTQDICRKYADQDSRIHYFHNNNNVGAIRNFNRVFELSKGKYFKWWAYDDLCAPEYIERCIRILEEFPSVIVCHPKTSIIDEKGNYLGDYDDLLDFRSKIPHKRFRNYLFRRAAMWNAIYGLIRVSELKKTPLYGQYLNPDMVLLGEFILRGEIHQIPERLFFRRNHPQQSWRAHRSTREMLSWINGGKNKIFYLPTSWKHFFEYLKAILRVGHSSLEVALCFFFLCKWLCREIASPVLKPLKATLMKSTNNIGNKNINAKANHWGSYRHSRKR